MDWRDEGIAYGDSGYCGSPTSLINFAEGAFAIVATIDLPTLTSLPLVTVKGKLVPEEWEKYYPTILSAFLSFQFVCRARGRHVKVFDCVERIDDSLTLLSAIYLLLSCFIPFSVKATLTWGPADREGGPYAFIMFQLLFVALDLVSLGTLFYTKRANLFYPTVLEPREDNVRVLMDEGATHRLHAQTKEAQRARQGHYNALCAQFCLTILINLLLMPLSYAHWSAAMAAALFFSSLAMKGVVGIVPFFRKVFKRELRQPLNKARQISYQDNVFSILATLLVLDVALPRRVNTADSFGHAIEINSYLMIGFGVAFLFTLSYWVLHKQIFAHITGLSTVWRQVNQTVIAITCYVPFASLQASKAVIIREDQSLFDCERQFATTQPMVAPNEEDFGSGINSTGNTTFTKDFEWQYNPVLMFYVVNLMAGLVFIAFWLSLQHFRPQFLSKDETLVAWRPLVFAKCCVMPMVSVIGFGLSFLRPRKIGMFAVLAIPVLWVIVGRIAGIRIQKNTRTRVDRTATMSHVLLASTAFKRLLERRRRATEGDPLHQPLLEEDEAEDTIQLATLAEEPEQEEEREEEGRGEAGHDNGAALHDHDDVETGNRAEVRGVGQTGEAGESASSMNESSM